MTTQTNVSTGRQQESKYYTFWVPRSFGWRLVWVLFFAGASAVIIAKDASVIETVFSLVLLYTWVPFGLWIIRVGNYVEISDVGLYLANYRGIPGKGHLQVDTDVRFAFMRSLRVRRSGAFELVYYREHELQDKVFKVAPDRRREFLDEFISRLREARPEGIPLKMDRELT